MSRPPAAEYDWAWLWRLLAVGYFVALVVGTHLPPSSLRVPPHLSDKLLHFGGFAGLAFLAAMAWETSAGRLNGRHLRLLWAAIAAFAVVDEVTQLLVGRDASVADWVADMLGAAVGLLVFRFCQRWMT